AQATHAVPSRRGGGRGAEARAHPAARAAAPRGTGTEGAAQAVSRTAPQQAGHGLARSSVPEVGPVVASGGMPRSGTRPPKPLRVIRSEAPIRICDNGGWTDTWFARHGKVVNVAVWPVAEVEIAVREERAGAPRVRLDVVNYGHRYALGAGER